MRFLKTSEAATLLNVTAATLRAWESRFDFPTPQRSAGNQRMYLYSEVFALREALRDCVSTSSAVRVAREALTARDSSLLAALSSYDRRQADLAMETALGSRSVQLSVEGVLLPALEQVARRRTLESAAWAFAARWGADWLRRATRLVAARPRRLSIMVGDATRDELDPTVPHIRALELFSVRAGVKVMSLSVRGVAGLADAVEAQRPDLIVIAGGRAGDEAVAAWARSVRVAAGPTPIALYRGGDPLARMPTTGTTVLPIRASEAHSRVIELAQTKSTTATPRTVPASPDSNVTTIRQQTEGRRPGHEHGLQIETG